jgi:hypothetical protein
MPVTIAFSGGVNATPAYGDRWLVGFSGTWAAGEEWSLELIAPASAVGNIMVGLGQLGGNEATVALNFNNRVYLGLSEILAFSDPTLGPQHWEEQDPGAGFLTFLSNFGNLDAIYGLAIFQGRLAIFGRYSVQIWQTNADPSQFNLLQVLANIGTESPLSVQQLGDYDVLFLDPGTGIRSLRAREVTLNAFVDDLGLPIDELVQAALALVGNNPTGVCGIVDPVTKRYWLFLTDTIYVLSLYRSSKVAAWTTYKPTYEVTSVVTPNSPTYDVNGRVTYPAVMNQKYYWTKGSNATDISFGRSTPATLTQSGYIISGSTTGTEDGTPGASVNSTLSTVSAPTAFTPEKFVIFNNQIYIRATDQSIYQYGGPSGQQYDTSILSVLLPFLDAKDPNGWKTAIGLSAAFSGAWTFSVSMDPLTDTPEQVLADGSSSAPSEGSDSTYDKGLMAFNAQGTHFQIKAVTAQVTPVAELSQLSFKYLKGRKL